MTPTLDAALCSWPFAPWLTVALLLTAAIYLRGWLALRRRDPHRWPPARLAAFLAGLAVIFIALASPVEPFASLLLQVHMVQHLLLMMAAPPLLWLGWPLLPLLRGLPRPVRAYWAAPLFRSPLVRRVFRFLTHPAPAGLLFVAATWLWHAPPVYDLALRSDGWHYLQHACFLGTALLFWFPVVRPYPARPRWSPWLLLPYLLLADVQNTALSALLTFSGHPLYPYYMQVPRLGGLTPLDDQNAAGLLMWVPGSLAFLLPLFGIGVRLLYGSGVPGHRPQPPGSTRRLAASGGVDPRRADPDGRVPLPLLAPPPHPTAAPSPPDLLRLPLLGRFLRWRHARLALQIPLLLLAAVLIYDGLYGPQVAPTNLAGILPWIHWRGLVVLGLLAAGNVFCLGCPFLLPRNLARRLLPARRAWPRFLRSKWLAVALVVLFLWAYEALALWDSPWLTAWVALAYFAAAFVVDGLFRGASFCKYVCPIGQFNFVQSLLSPLEVKVRDPAVCAGCRTKDCIRGRDGIPGCELYLFQPRKSGNLDCTFCLDCAHACPHGNVGLLPVTPGADLWHDPQRSGLGRFSRRPDLAALVLVLVFGAFANAAGMVGPVVEWQDRVGYPRLATTVFYLTACVLLPALAAGGAAALGRWWGRLPGTWRETAARGSFALVPLGLAMWLAHCSFHFLTSWDGLLPAVERFLIDLGCSGIGDPQWAYSCCTPVAGWLLRLEILALDVGLLLSLYAGWRIALSQAPRRPQALQALAPWAVLMVLLFLAGVWIVMQPMQMRGTMQMAG